MIQIASRFEHEAPQFEMHTACKPALMTYFQSQAHAPRLEAVEISRAYVSIQFYYISIYQRASTKL